MKILLVGGTGLIGQEVQQLLQEKLISCIAPGRDELNLEHPESIDSSLKKYQPDIVINCAGYNDPVKAENEPSKCFRINRDAMATLADCYNATDRMLLWFIFQPIAFLMGSKKRPIARRISPILPAFWPPADGKLNNKSVSAAQDT